MSNSSRLLDSPEGQKIALETAEKGAWLALSSNVKSQEDAILWANAYASWAQQANGQDSDYALTKHKETLSRFGVYPKSDVDFLVGLQTYTAQQLHEEDPPPPEFIVPGILPVGLTILGADAKARKTWTCLDLSLAVSQGKPFWGFPTKQARVLYLDLEGAKEQLNQRLKLMGGVFPEDLIFCHYAKTLNTGFIDQTRAFLENDKKIKLVIIDMLQFIRDGSRKGENLYQTDIRELFPLAQFALESKVAIIAVIHRNKGMRDPSNPYNSFQGSTGTQGTAQTLWSFDTEGCIGDDEKRFTMKSRFCADEQFMVCWDHVAFRYYVKGSPEALQEERERKQYLDSPLRKAVLEILGKESHVFAKNAEILDVAAQHGQYFRNTTESSRALIALIPKFAEIDEIFIKKGTLADITRKHSERGFWLNRRQQPTL